MLSSISTHRWQMPRLDRNDRWIGGVAAALAREIGVQPLVIRVAFILLATVGGWGLVLYAIAWAVLAVASPARISPYLPLAKGRTSVHRHLGVLLVVIGLILGFQPLTSPVFDDIVWPIGFILSGALIAWSRAPDEDGGISVVVRVIAGLTVAVGGILAFAALSFDPVNTLIALVFGIAIIAGIVLVAAPSVVRMAHDFDGERLRRTRADERARISAHLHDSVLQTLTLIQQNAADPNRTRHLARTQERELRNWLYGTTPSTPTGIRLGPALEQAAADVEDSFNVPIDVVAVGDTDDLAPDQVSALIAASREAMANAAEHSGADRIDVYGERRNGTVEVFVRDTGSGFDTTAVRPDRQGLTNSIVARMERAGGSAQVHTSPGAGTEIELRLPLPTTGDVS